MQARLVQVENGEELTSLSLADETIVIGRDPSAYVVLTDRRVSRRHVTIELVGDEHVVRDLGSTNGTRVNGEFLSGATPLRAARRRSRRPYLLRALAGAVLAAVGVALWLGLL